ncbi:MAG: type II secretion system minor pseudopilin GspH [Pseudomonadales bacterium]|nr:type II secretion system minor pseudopilin GspH [Pseudomonadales bacterium]
MAALRPRRRTAGFTLVEVLVTLFVIAVIAGVAVIRLGGGNRQEIVDREAARLAQVLELAREEAVLAGEEWGFALTPESYRFLRLDEDANRWLEVGERPLAPHELPEDVSLRLSLADRGRIDGRETTVVTRERAGQKPALLLLSSGEMTPFTLLVLSDAAPAPRRLTSDGFAVVRSEPVPEPR